MHVACGTSYLPVHAGPLFPQVLFEYPDFSPPPCLSNVTIIITCNICIISNKNIDNHKIESSRMHTDGLQNLSTTTILHIIRCIHTLMCSTSPASTYCQKPKSKFSMGTKYMLDFSLLDVHQLINKTNVLDTYIIYTKSSSIFQLKVG